LEVQLKTYWQRNFHGKWKFEEFNMKKIKNFIRFWAGRGSSSYFKSAAVHTQRCPGSAGSQICWEVSFNQQQSILNNGPRFTNVLVSSGVLTLCFTKSDSTFWWEVSINQQQSTLKAFLYQQAHTVDSHWAMLNYVSWHIDLMRGM
jgi:hypothetical protein